MKGQAKSNGIEALREVAALRHTFHIDGRLRLEFLSTVSKLLRDHEVPVSNRLLSAMILAIPGELSEGEDLQWMGNGDGSYALDAASVPPKAAVRKRAAVPPKAAVRKRASVPPKAAVRKRAAVPPKAAVRKRAAVPPKSA
jgi:hypothetical protein